ncbi:MAG: hypothetical protein S0880_01810 [Actinomycetota bacterium]|nr:hypothetical protein [Actinomycetota bacterium]
MSPTTTHPTTMSPTGRRSCTRSPHPLVAAVTVAAGSLLVGACGSSADDADRTATTGSEAGRADDAGAEASGGPDQALCRYWTDAAIESVEVAAAAGSSPDAGVVALEQFAAFWRGGADVAPAHLVEHFTLVADAGDALVEELRQAEDPATADIGAVDARFPGAREAESEIERWVEAECFGGAD